MNVVLEYLQKLQLINNSEEKPVKKKGGKKK